MLTTTALSIACEHSVTLFPLDSLHSPGCLGPANACCCIAPASWRSEFMPCLVICLKKPREHRCSQRLHAA